MCLSEVKGPYIAKKDIMVYKVFNTSEYSPTKLTSYYKHTYWPKEGLISKVHRYGNSVETGLHSFVLKKHANILKREGFRTFVRMCVIPKGSLYYRGYFRNAKSIASDRLVIKQYYKPKKK